MSEGSQQAGAGAGAGVRKVARLLRTVRYLRPSQVAWRVWYRAARPFLRVRSMLRAEPRALAPIEGIRRKATWVGDDAHRFLGETRRITGAKAWNDPGASRLWLYNLHYFDDLEAEGASARRAQQAALVARWIAENLVGSEPGWEPYPLSLRIVNWIKWASHGCGDVPRGFWESLAAQAQLLSRTVEWHVLGNHVLANGKALVFAGLCFEGADARRWLRRGLAILDREVAEQILPDGGHFERSPMYHALILEDVLDVACVLGLLGDAASKERIPRLRALAARMLDSLDAMTHPDGEIAFFNDAAMGIAPRPAALREYAARLGVTPAPTAESPVRWLEASGYVRADVGEAALLADVGEVGPSYQPGHAHADTLSFELSLRGARLFVNSGTSTYEADALRAAQRSTRAHNTVCVDDEDSSEVWSAFRVGARARPFGTKIEAQPGAVRIACSHDGYRRGGAGPIHRRAWNLRSEDLHVVDTIKGSFDRAVASYHLAPGVRIEVDPDGTRGQIQHVDEGWIAFEITGGRGLVETSAYYPEFGREIENRVLRVVFDSAEVDVRFRWGAGG